MVSRLKMTGAFVNSNLKVIIGILFLSYSFSVSAGVGTGSSGGGTGVLLKNGKVILSDLVEDSKISKSDIIQNRNDVLKLVEHEKTKMIFKSLQEKSGIKFPEYLVFNDLFQCAENIIIKANHSKFEKWIDILNKVRVLRVTRLLSLVPSQQVVEVKSESTDDPFFADASESHPYLQFALAGYNKGNVWIQSFLYDRMDDQNKCGLSIHEALRALNNSNLIAVKFKTSEIEQMTRDFIFHEGLKSIQILSDRIDDSKDPILQNSTQVNWILQKYYPKIFVD